MVPGARSQVVAGRLGPLLAEVTSEWLSGLRAGDTQPVCLGQSPQHQEAGDAAAVPQPAVSGPSVLRRQARASQTELGCRIPLLHHSSHAGFLDVT